MVIASKQRFCLWGTERLTSECRAGVDLLSSLARSGSKSWWLNVLGLLYAGTNKRRNKHLDTTWKRAMSGNTGLPIQWRYICLLWAFITPLLMVYVIWHNFSSTFHKVVIVQIKVNMQIFTWVSFVHAHSYSVFAGLMHFVGGKRDCVYSF